MCSLDLGCIGIMDGRLHGTGRIRYMTITNERECDVYALKCGQLL